ncbi:hypothetical protein AABB02_00025 [Streptomyces rimosus]|uniref:hypothetical protein n=1 Tax=Streptomyces rimosus TaxID=1927 RepID=UPI0031D3342A
MRPHPQIPDGGAHLQQMTAPLLVGCGAAASGRGQQAECRSRMPGVQGASSDSAISLSPRCSALEAIR